MKKSKTLTLIACALFYFGTCSSVNTQWVSQNSGTSTQLLSVYFVNQTTGFACGSNGKVLKTTNSGTDWQANTVVDTSAVFTSIHFINSVTGYMAGRILIFSPIFSAKPLILKTTNAGGTWNTIFSDSGYTLWSVYFINENTGFSGGGLFVLGPNKFLSTTNGGINWQVSSFIEPGYVGSVSFPNISTGFTASYEGYIYKTTNSGQNWNLLNHITSTVLWTSFVNSDFGFAAGGYIPDSSGKIFRTLNGGVNWETVYTDNLGLLNFVTFINSSTAFAVGQREYTFGTISARIIKTTNSGNNWFIDTLFSNVAGLASLYFTDLNTGYAVGSGGTILQTTTGGNVIGIESISKEIPKTFSLSQNYPNPFNPVTKIKFSLPLPSKGGAQNVRLVVFDVLGREIASLIPPFRGGQEGLQPGTYEVEWDASNYPSGVYFYKLLTADASAPLSIKFSETRKMVLVK